MDNNCILPCHHSDDMLNAAVFAEMAAKAAAWEVESTKRNALVEISRLESQITPRRTREAILGTDGGWFANQESLIVIERNKLGE